jgi:hypothetical protein
MEEVSGRRIGRENVRVGVCHGPDEEPTELVCSWHQRVGGHWRKLSGWFVIDADGWHTKCGAGETMACFGFRPQDYPVRLRRDTAGDLILTTARHGDECLFTLNGEQFVAEYQSAPLAARLHKIGRHAVILQFTADAPYRCNGAAVIMLRDAKVRWRFDR